MKHVIFIIWMLLSVVLCISVIGLILFIPKDTYQNADSNPSTWCTIGRKLVNDIID